MFGENPQISSQKTTPTLEINQFFFFMEDDFDLRTYFYDDDEFKTC